VQNHTITPQNTKPVTTANKFLFVFIWVVSFLPFYDFEGIFYLSAEWAVEVPEIWKNPKVLEKSIENKGG